MVKNKNRWQRYANYLLYMENGDKKIEMACLIRAIIKLHSMERRMAMVMDMRLVKQQLMVQQLE